MTYRLSRRAEADLTDIWLYSAERWRAEQADRYVDDPIRRFVWLAEHRSLWRPRPDLAERLRSYPQQSHVIYARQIDAAEPIIEIVRVLHGRMESDGLLE